MPIIRAEAPTAAPAMDEEVATFLEAAEQPRAGRPDARPMPCRHRALAGLAAAAAAAALLLAAAAFAAGARRIKAAAAEDAEVLVGAACANDMGPCMDSKCCKAAGSICFRKNSYWAACMATCVPGVHKDEPEQYQDPWSCEKLSEAAIPPTPPPPPVTTQPAELPTVPGRSAEVAAAAAEAEDAAPSLFCFATLSSEDAEELALAKSQLAKKTGIFGCDAWAVFSKSRSIELATEPNHIKTTVLPHSMVVGEGFKWRASLAALEKVYLDGAFKNSTVVVKASFKAVFLPGRLRDRVRLGQLKIGSEAVYVRTDQAAFGGKGGMVSALEVMSAKALEMYGHGRLRNAARCMVELPYQDLPEATYLRECFDVLEVGHVEAFDLLEHDADSCVGIGPVAYYSYDRPETYDLCYSQTGQA